MNIRMVWLTTADPKKPEEHLVYLDHVTGMGQDNVSGYIVREKMGSSGTQRPQERLLTPRPMRYQTALEYWRVTVKGSLDKGYVVEGGSEYDERHFTLGMAMPLLRDHLLAHLAQPNEFIYAPPAEAVRAPKPKPPQPAPQPISLPPYNPPPINFNTPHEPRPASKPKPKPARRLPISTGRRITLED